MPDLTMEYLAELLKEKRQLAFYGNVFLHVERLIDQEISRVRAALFQIHFKDAIELPEPDGEVTVKQEKIVVPVKEHPEYNFVGRILGPRGMTAKQFEVDTECKIMVRGKGSLRDGKKEEMMRGKPTWEHLDDDLHVIVQCEDTPNRAKVKLENAVKQLKKLLVPNSEGSDELKRKQLMELAIINGTYRSANKNRDPYRPIVPSNIVSSSVGKMNSPLRPPGFASPCFIPQSPIGHPILGGSSTTSNQRRTLDSFLPSSPFEFSDLAQILSPIDSASQHFPFNYDFNGTTLVL